MVGEERGSFVGEGDCSWSETRTQSPLGVPGVAALPFTVPAEWARAGLFGRLTEARALVLGWEGVGGLCKVGMGESMSGRGVLRERGMVWVWIRLCKCLTLSPRSETIRTPLLRPSGITGVARAEIGCRARTTGAARGELGVGATGESRANEARFLA